MAEPTGRNNDNGFAEAEARIEQARKKGSVELELIGLNLIELPESLGQLQRLQVLHLHNNRLTQLPELLCQLQELQELDLSDNQLTELPESLGQLQGLQKLYLDTNKLTKLPESLGQLQSLQELYLSVNQLTELPESLGQLQGLQVLYLSDNKLNKLPESLGQLQGLQALRLFNNQLTQLPESLWQLPRLRVFDLSVNQLTELPELLGQLQKLQGFYLSHNQFTWLPESLGQLQNLQALYLNNNKLIGLPESLLNLRSLTILFLQGNSELSFLSGVMPPTSSEVFTRNGVLTTPSDILQYYFRVQKSRRPLNEAKLILVGRGNVGKTSLVNRLVHNSFSRTEQKTEGIQITQWPLSLQNKDEVLLHVWDFGGQEIMHATHQFFLTQRSLYLLVLNGREGGEDADAEYWLKLIESFGGDSPIVVVLNKIKENPFDLNGRGLMQKYPFIKGFIKTDCEDGTGITQLLQTIQRETDLLEHLRDAFPASWFAIKQNLSRLDKNYLNFEEFRDLCNQNGEQDEKAQELLARYLHNLGIALNYRDDPRLQEMHVLNPHWVTNGIYKILNAPQIEQQKGVLTLNDTDRILDSREYPSHMRRFILDLMKKFELCFGFLEDDYRYLIPELLPKEEPLDTSAFEEDCLQFQYYYPILPEGLLPRFIVRTHVLSEGLPRWRTGAILQFEDNRALVKADVQDKKVFIKVSGPMAGRRRLLAIIRSDFERIHYDIRHLNPLEMVPLPEFPEVVIPYKKLLVMEEKKVEAFSEVVGDDVIEVSVLSLLNGVDLAEIRRRDIKTGRHSEAVRLFYSYSHKDEGLRNELETHLKLLQRQNLIISTWHDRQIEAGEEWKQKIDDNLEQADIILLLVSADFIASDYCYAIEMKRALERHEKGEARVIPVIVRDVNMSGAPFVKLQALPKDALAVTLWPNKDSAWKNVSEGIENAAKAVRQKRGFV